MHIYLPQHERPPVQALTGIRFIAAFSVLLFHSGAGFAAHHNAPRFIVNALENGYLGVSIFFILSGFILTYNYSNKLTSSRGDLLEFALSRFARIYPVYILSLILMLPLVVNELHFIDSCRVLLMVQSWTFPDSYLGYAWIMQAWTLSIELAFYIAFPAILHFISRLETAKVAFPLAICFVLMVALATPTAGPGSVNRPFGSDNIPLPLLRMVEFVFGMLLCRAFLFRPQWLKRLSGIAMTLAVVVTIILIISTTKNMHAVSFAAALVGLLILQLAAGNNIITRGLGVRPMIILGGSSYALYLLQNPLREWLRFLPSEALQQAIYPFIAIGVSVLVFLLWEQPLRRWVRHLSRYTGRKGDVVPPQDMMQPDRIPL